jgi:hypothetical protein
MIASIGCPLLRQQQPPTETADHRRVRPAPGGVGLAPRKIANSVRSVRLGRRWVHGIGDHRTPSTS